MIKCAILSENKYGDQNQRTLFRNIGAMEVARRFRNHGIETTVFEWFAHWTDDQLVEGLELWFKGSDRQIIGISTTFDLGNFSHATSVIQRIKQLYPKVKIIVGGNRTYDPVFDELVDMVFVGRSMEVLDAWIKEENLTKYATTSPKVLMNRSVNFDKDTPVLPDIQPCDMLNSGDILGFEIAVGCKFNCSFCSFDLRGAKNPLLQQTENLANFLQSAYDLYGITNFYIADDTINEQDSKLEILAQAVESLTFKPNLSGYFRLDLFEARPHQYELLKRCDMRGLNFGIETFSPRAAKAIKKSANIDKIFTALEKIKHYAPNAITSSGVIVGLSYDSEQTIFKGVEYIRKNRLLDSISPYALGIPAARSDIYDANYMSNIAKDPEQYGYTTMAEFDVSSNRRVVDWKNDWCDRDTAEQLSEKLCKHLKQHRVASRCAYDALIFLAQGLIKNVAEERSLLANDVLTAKSAILIDKHKSKYVGDKLAYLNLQQGTK